MASVTLGPTYGWHVGDTISAYLRDARNVQTGSAVATATVASDSTTTFTGLADDAKFVASNGTVAVQFATLTDSVPVSSADVSTIVELTQAEYDALPTPDAATLYVVVG